MESMKKNAFSLLELLVVMAIIALMAAFAMPAITSMMAGSNLNRGGQLFADEFSFARQTALTKNRSVEVRFIQIPDSLGVLKYRAVQLWLADEAGNRAPLGKLKILPDGIVPVESLSPLIFGGGAMVSGEVDLAGRGSHSFKAFHFRPSGGTDIPSNGLATAPGYLTLKNETAQESPPANFYTIQINPITGKATIFRP